MDVATETLAAGTHVQRGTTRVRARVSAGHVVMLVAALLAIVLNAALLRANAQTVPVAVAAADIRAGALVEPATFRFTHVRVDADLLASLVTPQSARALTGWVATAALPAGAIVRTSDLRPPSAPAAARAMSLPVTPEHAVGGAIAVGDRVDVIDVRDGEASYVTTGAEVLDVTTGARGALPSLGGMSITIAVDSETALRLAVALRSESLEIVRSTGATPAAATRPRP